MDSRVEKRISNLIAQQFPAFYRDEGTTFIAFVKAYYEWLEQEGKVLYQARRIAENRDIDETVEEFLYYFQKKYLYGIPFDVIINKRFLLKHVLDAYRSKGSIQCYRLLFKLIYDQDIDVYLPGIDVLRASDGTWKEPRYLEITNVENVQDLVGTTIIGISSKTKAVVESYIVEPINSNLIATLYISNITPRNATFFIGEKIIDERNLDSDELPDIIQTAPSVTGSLDSIEIINGARDFTVGDILKIVSKDLTTGAPISYGVDGTVRVTGTVRGRGSLQFDINNPGSGIRVGAAEVYMYNALTDTLGQGASFEVDQMANVVTIQYNTDVISTYLDTALNATAYNLPANAAANLSSNVGIAMSYSNAQFGSLLSLTNIRTGNNYQSSPLVFIRSTQTSLPLGGTISYANNSNTITGTSTSFQRFFSNGDVIYLQANSSLSNTAERHIIRQVVSNTQITLYKPPARNSTASAQYRAAPPILVSNFAAYEPTMFTADGSIPGLNANVSGITALGNNVISNTVAINSGKGYVEGEIVTMYLYGSVSTPVIVNGGTGYTNGDLLIFSGGEPIELARGTVATTNTGVINAIAFSYAGSGYRSTPTITVKSKTGNGAVITTTLEEFNTVYEVTGRVRKGGVGRGQGYWTTTRGFLNSDKYLQDSYFYQDFSYQIKVASALEKYRDILYNTFHIAGTALFGEYLLITSETSAQQVLFESNSAIITTS